MTEPDQVVEGRPRRSEFAGNRKRFRPGDPIPALQFGQHGELTPRTIKQANLTKDEEKRAFEMLKVQAAYLEILDCLSYPVDPAGHVHDLTAIGPTKQAIAWTLALNGFRSTGKKYIKKKVVPVPGGYPDAHTWIDARQREYHEMPPEDGLPDDLSNYTLPPETKKISDAAPAEQLSQGWHVRPKITYVNEPRKSPAAPHQENSS